MIFKKLHPDAKEPVRSTEHSAGLDIFSDEDIHMFPFETVVVPTGVAFENARLPKNNDFFEDNIDWFIDLRIRSSLGAKGIMLANGAGVIDRDYAGKEIFVLLYNGSDENKRLKKGDKIAQMIIMEHLSKYAKGVTFKYNKRAGGLGSTS